MNKTLIIILSVVIGIIASSFFWMGILNDHEMGHRNFEYIQCEQFFTLAEKYVTYDYETIDCESILKYGVLEFKIGEFNEDSLDRKWKKDYAYQDYVNDIKGGKSE